MLATLGLFLTFLCAALAAGAGGMLFPAGAWYASLDKPDWRPPNWMFPVAWSIIYTLAAFAAARVAGAPGSGLAMAFWALQIALNALWSPVFFGLRRMGAALAILIALWFAVLGAMVAHWRVDVWAGAAFAPYLLWASYAFALNLSTWRRNPDVAPLRPDAL